MNLVKLAVISLVLLFLVSTAISLLIPSQIRISRATNLGKSQGAVLDYIKDSSRWKEWHPAYREVEKGISGPGIKSTLLLQNDSEIVVRQQQGDKGGVINGWKLYSYPQSDSITLQWYMDFKLSWYPWQKFRSLFFEKTYGIMMEQGLTRLKDLSSPARPDGR